MFVIVCTSRARAGEEDAIVALHEDGERHQRPKARGYVSGELLKDTRDPRTFIAITRYESEAAARAAIQDPEQMAWYRRLASLSEAGLTLIHCQSAWQA